MRRIFCRRLVMIPLTVVLLLVGLVVALGEYALRADLDGVGRVPDISTTQAFTVASRSGAILSGWQEVPHRSKQGVILLHGDGAHRRQMLEESRFLVKAGYATWIADLYAHGESWGDRPALGRRARHDVEALYAHVGGRFRKDGVALIGRGLGAAAIILAGPKVEAHALVLESPYATLDQALAARIDRRLGSLSFLAAPYVRWWQDREAAGDLDAWHPQDHIAALEAPLLILGAEGASDEDRRSLESLQRRATSPALLRFFQGAANSDLHASDRATYEREVLAFLREHMPR